MDNSQAFNQNTAATMSIVEASKKLNNAALEDALNDGLHKAFIDEQMLYLTPENQAELLKKKAKSEQHAFMARFGLLKCNGKPKPDGIEKLKTESRPPRRSRGTTTKAGLSTSLTSHDVQQSRAGASSTPAQDAFMSGDVSSSQSTSSNGNDAPMPVPSNAEEDPFTFDGFDGGEAMDVHQPAVSAGAEGQDFNEEPHFTSPAGSTLIDQDSSDTDSDVFVDENGPCPECREQTNTSDATVNPLPRNPMMGNDYDFDNPLVSEGSEETNPFAATANAFPQDPKLHKHLSSSHTTAPDADMDTDDFDFGFSTANGPAAYDNSGQTDPFHAAMGASPQQHSGNANVLAPHNLTAPIADADTNIVHFNKSFPGPVSYSPFDEMGLYNGATPLQQQSTIAKMPVARPAALAPTSTPTLATHPHPTEP